MTRKRVAILISGRGSNMAALLAAAKDPTYPAEIVLVLSSRPDAPGLQVAAESGVRTVAIDHTTYPTKTAFEAALETELRKAAVDLVCLAGFMRLLTPGFVERWRNRILNIHPSLLPEFPGLDTHARALAAGARHHGATVHFVRAETDTGPIVTQSALNVRPDDTAESLAERVLALEHRLYPEALRMVASGEVTVEGERAVSASRIRPPFDRS
jgi:phosphoribosylglycinamide formyltransferase 1